MRVESAKNKFVAAKRLPASKSMQDIIRDQQDEVGRYELSAMEDKESHLKCSLLDGEHVETKER